MLSTPNDDRGPSAAPRSLSTRLLSRLADVIYRFPRLFFYPQILLFAASILYTVAKLEFSTSRNDLVGSEKKYHQNFLRFKQDFPGQDDLVAVVESEDMEKNRQFVERLGRRIESETNLFTDVFYKGDLKLMGPKALLFLPKDTLGELHQTLRDYRPFIDQFSQATNLTSLFDLVNRRFYAARREASGDNEGFLKAFPALERIVRQADASLKRFGPPPSPGLDALFGAGEEAERQKYITFAQGRIYLVSAKARTEGQNEDAVRRLRALVLETQKEVPGVNVGVTGEPVLEIDEMEQSQTDSIFATIVSLVIVVFLFVYGYRETGRPLKATACLIIGLGYTMAFTTASVGHLNILTITFVPMLIGLAIDFGVHLISRYEEELRSGATERQALEKAVVNTGQGIFTGCFTTAGAFLAMGITDFKGIQEMGIICGGGLLICLIPMMTLLPVLLLRGRQNQIDHTAIHGVEQRERWERLWLNRPVWVVIFTVAISILSALQLRRVGFDYNLLHMQSEGLPAVEFEQKLVRSAGKSVLYGAVVANSVPEAKALQHQLTNLVTVSGVDSMAAYLDVDATEQLATISEIRKELSTIRFASPDRDKARVGELGQILWSLGGYLGLAGEAVNEELRKLEAQPGPDQASEVSKLKSIQAQMISLRSALETFRRTMASMDRSKAEDQLALFQQTLFQDIHETFAALRGQDDRAALTAADLPSNLRNRFIGRGGKHLLQVYPKEDVWDREPQEKFVSDLRTVAPEVTGTPVQLFEYTTLLKTSYERAAWYALIAISILVFIHFRSLSCVVLSLLPVLLGTLWMVGLMGWRGIDFNPANIMTLPLVIGIGITSGIHILNRFAEEQNPSIFAKSTGKAVLISALTTVAGFGSLVLAQHQGIRSLGFVMAVGTSTCMIAALVFIPALLNLLTRAGWQMKKPSVDNAQSPLGLGETEAKNLN